MAFNLFLWSFIFPFCSIPWARDLHANGECGATICAIFIPLVLYLGSSTYACVLAHKLKFHAYKLSGANNSFSALVGGFFFWSYYFPSFLINYYLINTGEVEKRPEGSLWATSKNGRVIIIVSIWMAMWFIPATQIVPSVSHRKTKIDYTNAVKGLESYYRAQMTFNSTGYKRNNGITFNTIGYCDNFRNLYYGLNNEQKHIQLLPKEVADSFAFAPCGLATMGNGRQRASQSLGFHFFDDPYICANNLWNKQFGLFAIPVTFFPDTSILLWMGADHVIMHTPITIEEALEISDEDSPVHPSCRRKWLPYQE